MSKTIILSQVIQSKLKVIWCVKHMIEIVEIVSAVVGTICSLLLYMSPFFQVRNAIRHSCVKEINPLVYPVATANAVAFCSYGIVKDNPVIFLSNAPGLFFTFPYTVLTYRLSEGNQKRKIEMIMGSLFTLILVNVTLVAFVFTDVADSILGFQANFITLTMFSSPLFVMYEVIRERNAFCVDPILCAMQFLVSLCWATYGLVQEDPFIYVVNIIGVLLAVVQTILILMFGRERKHSKEVELP